MSKKSPDELVVDGKRAAIAAEVLGPRLADMRSHAISRLMSAHADNSLTLDQARAIAAEILVCTQLEAFLTSTVNRARNSTENLYNMRRT